jgi:gamma-glutamyl hercynylcysteine S-oxide synthase
VPSPATQTPPPGGAATLLRERYAELLGEARDRTLALVDAVGPEDLDRVHSRLMSPLAWDLGHIAAFEDLWLSCRAGDGEPLRPELMGVYDADETPRARRGQLEYLHSGEVRAFMHDVRARSLDRLEGIGLDGDAGLDSGGYVWELVVQHESQHNETMLQTLRLAEPGVFSPARRRLPSATAAQGPDMVRVDGGAFLIGALDGLPSGDGRFSYDNERPQVEVELPAFEIDRLPVTNAAYMDWIEEGGYSRRAWWSEEGWSWRQSQGVERPLYWTADGEERSFDATRPLDPSLPVMHVSFHEARAFARSRGKRLPTEAEWEKAASSDAGAGAPRRYPWGDEPPDGRHANLDQTGFGAAPVGSYPDGAAACGALGLVGDAWEWTSSSFAPYPGFKAFPYREYSEAFFDGPYRVLRGGSWATRARVARNTFRNWDFPERRQIFSGFRCVQDL